MRRLPRGGQGSRSQDQKRSAWVYMRTKIVYFSEKYTCMRYAVQGFGPVRCGNSDLRGSPPIRLDLQLVFFPKEGCLFPHNSWWFLLAKKGWIRLMMSQCNDVLMTMQRLYMSCFCCKTAKRFLLVLLLLIIFRSLVSRMPRDFGRKINRKL